MKMMAIGAAAGAALLMSAAPAAAQSADQQKADPNAVCLIAVIEIVMLAEKRGDDLSEEMKSVIPNFRNAVYFHAGMLQGRYAGAGLDPVMKAAGAEYMALPRDARAEVAADCAAMPGPVLKAISQALAKAATGD